MSPAAVFPFSFVLCCLVLSCVVLCCLVLSCVVLCYLCVCVYFAVPSSSSISLSQWHYDTVVRGGLGRWCWGSGIVDRSVRPVILFDSFVACVGESAWDEHVEQQASRGRCSTRRARAGGRADACVQVYMCGCVRGCVSQSVRGFG